MSSQGGWDVGGYAPIGYRVTPWTTLFPALGSFTKAKTLSSIYIAKLYTYYLTRVQFGQYLTFLGDVGPANCENDAIATDSLIYTDHCSRLRQTIADASAGNTVTSDTYEAIVTDFEAALSTSGTFSSQVVYTRFFAHYSFFVQCAYGCILRMQFSGEDSYLAVGGLKPTPAKPFSVFPMLADAVRQYPVLTREGGLKTGSYSDESGSWEVGYGEMGDPEGVVWDPEDPHRAGPCYHEAFDAPVLLDHGFRYIRSHEFMDGPWLLYMIGHDTVPENYPGKIRGLPMLYKMPFDFLASYADPGKP